MGRPKKVRDPDFADSLRAMRVALDKPQHWITFRLQRIDPNVSQSHIYYYESGKLVPPKEIKCGIKMIFSQEIQAQTRIYGEWKKELITIRYLTELIHINSCNYEKQKKHYNLLRRYIKTHSNMPEWDLKVFDPAFGEMHVFEEDGT